MIKRHHLSQWIYGRIFPMVSKGIYQLGFFWVTLKCWQYDPRKWHRCVCVFWLWHVTVHNGHWDPIRLIIGCKGRRPRMSHCFAIPRELCMLVFCSFAWFSDSPFADLLHQGSQVLPLHPDTRKSPTATWHHLFWQGQKYNIEDQLAL